MEAYLAIPLDKVNPAESGEFWPPPGSGIRASAHIQRLADRAGDFGDIGHAVHRAELALAAVIADQRLGLGAIGLEPRPHRLRIVVRPPHLSQIPSTLGSRNVS